MAMEEEAEEDRSGSGWKEGRRSREGPQEPRRASGSHQSAVAAGGRPPGPASSSAVLWPRQPPRQRILRVFIYRSSGFFYISLGKPSVLYISELVGKCVQLYYLMIILFFLNMD